MLKKHLSRKIISDASSINTKYLKILKLGWIKDHIFYNNVTYNMGHILFQKAASSSFKNNKQTLLPFHASTLQSTVLHMHRGFAMIFCPPCMLTPSPAFWISNFQVTQGLYELVMGTTPSEFKGYADSHLRPVESVSWLDAVEFCNRLSDRDGLERCYFSSVDPEAKVGSTEAFLLLDTSKNGYRLPTRAEWRFAAEASSSHKWSGVDSLESLKEIAWFGDYESFGDSLGNSGGSTQPVGRLKPNNWGIYDMTGNVWEWCSAPEDSASRFRWVFGGSWSNVGALMIIEHGIGFTLNTKMDTLGFRLARNFE